MKPWGMHWIATEQLVPQTRFAIPNLQAAVAPLSEIGQQRVSMLPKALTAIELDLYTFTFWEIKGFSTKPEPQSLQISCLDILLKIHAKGSLKRGAGYASVTNSTPLPNSIWS